MMRTGKANALIYIVLGALLVVVAVLALINRSDAEIRRALEENREFLVNIDGEHVATVDFQYVLDLKPQEFTTPFATSVTVSRDTELLGVELRILLEALDIDISEAKRFTASGLDGYFSPLTREEVEREETVYICYSMDGKILTTKSEGGYGPFMMVIRDTSFAQRWCKYLGSIDVVTS